MADEKSSTQRDYFGDMLGYSAPYSPAQRAVLAVIRDLDGRRGTLFLDEIDEETLILDIGPSLDLAVRQALESES